MKNARKFLFLCALLLATYTLPARAAASPLSILNFQVAGIGAWTGPASSYFGQVSWTPYIAFGPVGIRGEIGLTSFDFGGGRFLATNYEALLHLPFFPGFGLEIGGGMHLWHGHGAAATAFTGNFVIGSPLGVDRLFVGYSRYTGGIGANELRVGIGFEL